MLQEGVIHFFAGLLIALVLMMLLFLPCDMAQYGFRNMKNAKHISSHSLEPACNLYILTSSVFVGLIHRHPKSGRIR